MLRRLTANKQLKSPIWTNILYNSLEQQRFTVSRNDINIETSQPASRNNTVFALKNFIVWRRIWLKLSIVDVDLMSRNCVRELYKLFKSKISDILLNENIDVEEKLKCDV